MGTLVLLRKCLTLSLSLKYVRHQHINASRLFLEEFGDPAKVVKKENFNLYLPGMKNDQVVFNIFLKYYTW